MAFKSKAQERKFGEMLNEKKVTKKLFNDFKKDTPSKLPDRIGPAKPITSVDQMRAIGKKKFGK